METQTQTQTLPTEKQLKRAIVLRGQIVSIKEKLEEKQKELTECLTFNLFDTVATDVPIKVRKTRVMSEEGRKRIAEAQRARWAKTHAENNVNKKEVKQNKKEVKQNNKESKPPVVV